MEDGSTYYFALAAFDTLGNRSVFSEEICVEVKGSSVTNCRAATSGDGSSDESSGSDLDNLMDDLIDLKNLGCFISTAETEINKFSQLSGTCLSILCILIFGLIGVRGKMNSKCPR